MPTGLERPFSKISDGSNNYSVKDSTARSDIATLNTRITNLEIDDLANINITSPTNGQALIYDATSEEWKNGAGGGGNVNEWVGTTSEFEEAIEQGEIADDTNILITNDYSGGGGGAQTLGELADTTISNPIDGQSLVYDGSSDMWKNGMIKSGMLPKLYIHSEAGESQVKATSPSGTVIIATQVVGSTTVWECDAPEFGVYTIDAIKDGDDYQTTITVDTVKVYHIDDYHYSYTLSVYAPFGSTVRVSATGETYTDTGEGENPVIFGLHQASTEYTVQVTVDGISESNTIESAATTGEDGDITFTFGTIVLTYVDDFKGVNITCTKSETVITKKAPTSNNVMYFYPNDIGTWVISGEVQSGGIFSVTATVESLSTPVYVDLLTTPEGSTVTPTDDIQTWLACANITDKSYTTLAEVLADRETFETLIADSNACDYMARSTTWANPGLVPKMTSNTTPEGIADADSEYDTTYQAYKAFNRTNADTSDCWASTGVNTFPKYLQYKFEQNTIVRKVKITLRNGQPTVINSPKEVTLKGYNGSSYDSLGSYTNNSVTPCDEFEFTVNNNTQYQYYKLEIASINLTESPSSGSYYCSIAKMKYYEYADASIVEDESAMSLIGKYDYCSNALLGNATWAEAIANSDYFEEVLNVKVPTMTSDTTPEGQVVKSGQYQTSEASWKAFDGDSSTHWSSGTSGSVKYLGYIFTSPVCVNCMHFEIDSADRIPNFTIQAYDGNTWDDITTAIVNTQASRTYDFANNTDYSGYRISVTTNGAVVISKLQFYGRRASSNVSNTNGIIHTANGDTVTCNGNTYVADVNGIIDIDFSDFDEGTYTFTSGIAKDPTDLSNYYSKSFKITKSPYGGTTELYLMPDTVKTLYWWGYEGSDLEDCTSANGWSTSGRTMVAPTHNTNDITINSTSTANYACGVGSKNKVTGNTHCIAEGITASNGYYWYYRHGSVKVYSSMTTDESITTNTKQKVDKNVEDSYITVNTLSQNGNAKVYALWYE